MRQRIGKSEFAMMFACAAKQIRREHLLLSELDSIAGDGDHGATMLRVADQLEVAIDPASQESLINLLKKTGWSVLGVDGGASSAILGTFLSGMGDANIGEEISCNDLASLFESGLCAVKNQTNALPGDKTMMDALVPAITALRSAASAGGTISQALEKSAIAAHMGACSTSSLIAKHGRAKYLGEKTRGHIDAGAFSVSLLFAGFSAAATNNERK